MRRLIRELAQSVNEAKGDPTYFEGVLGTVFLARMSEGIQALCIAGNLIDALRAKSKLCAGCKNGCDVCTYLALFDAMVR